jgi:PHS family inorganic phosphate transporter-like MFS transporter
MTIPMIAHVYYHNDMPRRYEVALRTTALVGTIIGQVGFGLLADVYGRRRIYGLELVIIIIGALGGSMGSRGESSISNHDESSMRIIGWLIFWRVIIGIGIGADYSLSAVITSEWAPARHRAQMLACVFFAQPLGYLLATIVALGFTIQYKGRIPTDEHVLLCTDDDVCRIAVDSVWRWVVGFGAVPAVLAIFARFFLEESPMYTMDVLNRHVQARLDYYRATARDLPEDNLGEQGHQLQQVLQNVVNQGGPGHQQQHHPPAQPVIGGNGPGRHTEGIVTPGGQGHEQQNPSPPQPQLIQSEGLILPVANSNDPNQYTQGIMTPGGQSHEMQSEGATLPVTNSNGSNQYTQGVVTPQRESRWAEFRSGFRRYFRGHWGILLGTSLSWMFFDVAFYALGANSSKVVAKLFASEPLKPKDKKLPRSIYQDLLDNSWHSLVVVSIGSMLGGVIMIISIPYFHPRNIQITGFLVLTLLLIATGLYLRSSTITHETAIGPVILYILCEVFFEIGPNFTTFIIPAQLFPTRYRCTATGISAASGKFGAVLIQVFVRFAMLDGLMSTDDGTKWLGIATLVFACAMLLGAVVTVLLVPRTRGLTFEAAENLPNLPPEGQRVRDFFKMLVRPVQRLFRAVVVRESGGSQATPSG